MEQKVTLNVFLSYRAHYQEILKGLEKSFDEYNAKSDAKYALVLKASESELIEGDSITAFMDEIGTARFVILLLTKDYFESPYCLHELLEINRNENAETRLFPLTIKYDDEISKLTTDTVVEHWQKDHVYCRPRLKELQQPALKKLKINTTNEQVQEADIESRLITAEEKLVKLLRDDVNTVSSVQQLVDKLINKADEAFSAEEKGLHAKLISEITLQINRIENQDDLDILQKHLGEYCDANNKIASCLVEKDSDDAMLIMQKWVDEVSRTTDDNKQWKRFFRCVESMCGWLLLKSVNQTWWIHNKTRLDSAKKDESSLSAGIEQPAYTEVVISRSLLEAAQYALNEQHSAIPARFDKVWDGFSPEEDSGLAFEEQFVMDATNPDARIETLLSPLVHDLLEKPRNLPREKSKLLEAVISNAEVRYEKTYYVVTPNYLKRLAEEKINDQSVLEQINEKLGDQLFFVTYGETCSHTEKGMEVCQDEKRLLTRMAYILRKNKNRQELNT